MISITQPAGTITVGPGAGITFQGTGGPAVSYKVLDSGGGTVEDTTLNPPTPPRWSVSITAPQTTGTYTFRVSDGKLEDEKGFIVSSS